MRKDGTFDFTAFPHYTKGHGRSATFDFVFHSVSNDLGAIMPPSIDGKPKRYQVLTPQDIWIACRDN